MKFEYKINIDKILLKGDIWNQFNYFDEINLFDFNSTDTFKDGLAFFGL